MGAVLEIAAPISVLVNDLAIENETQRPAALWPRA
jgi:hypothetical protein